MNKSMEKMWFYGLSKVFHLFRKGKNSSVDRLEARVDSNGLFKPTASEPRSQSTNFYGQLDRIN